MYAVYGSTLTAGAIVAIALLSLLFGNPNAPRWIRRELTAQLTAVVVTAVLGVGLVLLAVTVRQIWAEGATLTEIAAFAAGLGLVWLILRALKVDARLQAYQAMVAPGLTVAPVEPPLP